MNKKGWSVKKGETSYEAKKSVNRTCRRCKLKQSIDDMHKSKSWHGYLCNDRLGCTRRLNETNEGEHNK